MTKKDKAMHILSMGIVGVYAGLIVSVILFLIATTYKTYQSRREVYDKAIIHYESGDYRTAYYLFDSIEGWKDANQYKNDILTSVFDQWERENK